MNPTYFKRLVGSLRYLSSTRPDILYGVGITNMFMESLHQSHLYAIKRILRYIKGTLDVGIFHFSTDKFGLVGYTNNDWAGNYEKRKSTS